MMAAELRLTCDKSNFVPLSKGDRNEVAGGLIISLRRFEPPPPLAKGREKDGPIIPSCGDI
jgi:hypothetical protein